VLRGVKFIQVPTTLLAQVDSSVGGKVGIDHPLGKNLIGAFHQPSAVFVDPILLKSLSDREFRNGLAEVAKIAAALDGRFFELLERKGRQIRKGNSELLEEIISRSVRLKAAVVENDEFESGLRKALNLGHTIGHAIESALDYRIKHGEAVAIGIVAESSIAVKLGILRQQDCNRVIALLKALKLPTKFPVIKQRARFLSALSSDKKAAGSGSRFVLLNSIGSSTIGVDVPHSFIEQLLKS
jgi:3-dehydroquinate synthase